MEAEGKFIMPTFQRRIKHIVMRYNDVFFFDVFVYKRLQINVLTVISMKLTLILNKEMV